MRITLILLAISVVALVVASILKPRCSFYSREYDILEGVQVCGFIAAVVLAIVCFFVQLNISDKQQDKEPVVVYTTAPDKAISGISTTAKEQYKLLITATSGFVGEHTVYAGKIVKILEVGGGISQVCVSRPGEKILCGSTALPLRMGDKAYIREINALYWGDADGRDANYRPENIVITRPEAEQLVAAGEFKLEE